MRAMSSLLMVVIPLLLSSRSEAVTFEDFQGHWRLENCDPGLREPMTRALDVSLNVTNANRVNGVIDKRRLSYYAAVIRAEDSLRNLSNTDLHYESFSFVDYLIPDFSGEKFVDRASELPGCVLCEKTKSTTRAKRTSTSLSFTTELRSSNTLGFGMKKYLTVTADLNLLSSAHLKFDYAEIRPKNDKTIRSCYFRKAAKPELPK